MIKARLFFFFLTVTVRTDLEFHEGCGFFFFFNIHNHRGTSKFWSTDVSLWPVSGLRKGNSLPFTPLLESLSYKSPFCDVTVGSGTSPRLVITPPTRLRPLTPACSGHLPTHVRLGLQPRGFSMRSGEVSASCDAPPLGSAMKNKDVMI